MCVDQNYYFFFKFKRKKTPRTHAHTHTCCTHTAHNTPCTHPCTRTHHARTHAQPCTQHSHTPCTHHACTHHAQVHTHAHTGHAHTKQNKKLRAKEGNQFKSSFFGAGVVVSAKHISSTRKGESSSTVELQIGGVAAPELVWWSRSRPKHALIDQLMFGFFLSASCTIFFLSK
jgi:hypothetical protein